MHIEELKEDGENPEDYYESLPGTLQYSDSEVSVSDEEESSDDDTDALENDPLNLPDEEILEYAVLEEMQEEPLNEEDIGQQPNIEMEERGGFMYPVLNRTEKTVDIPFVSGNPFGGSESESEELDDPNLNDRFNDGTDNYEEEAAGLDVDDNYENEHVDAVVSNVSVDEGGDSEPEEVCFGDEYVAESSAMARKNDGIQNVGQRQFVSLAEYGNFIIQDREEVPCRFQADARTLGQLHVIDIACRVREARMNVLVEKRTEFSRTSDRGKLFQFYKMAVKNNWKGQKKLGCLTTLPATVPGTIKYQRELVMSAVTLANNLGKPQIFITFTGNPYWDEIKDECQRLGCEWADIPDFVNKCFLVKFEMMLEDVVGEKKKSSKKEGGKIVRKPGIFGVVTWYTYSVEFQQRGMPHVHLLLSLEDPITTAAQVDQIVQAEVPEMPSPTDPQHTDKLLYYNAVKDKMVHRPCNTISESYCRIGAKPHWNQCNKGFPKKLTDVTILTDNQYPDYKRNNQNFFEFFDRGVFYRAGSEWVVSLNKYLLMKYGCHINVEIVSSIKMMKYMFKYIFKGSDRVLLEPRENMTNVTPAPLFMR
ncbi:hypothetical protein CAEBREN_28384 [Caenorhabditis brenneri]|uniref:Helitron helicase-like domain-containing protein n=1 Tax=Caenorhabditis brenneri TaxID=135651 RepID=G0NF75_CAEBE|nr:hypothetical protein CAEBREN_28384 [Caenorhabditis brenneri]